MKVVSKSAKIIELIDLNKGVYLTELLHTYEDDSVSKLIVNCTIDELFFSNYI